MDVLSELPVIRSLRELKIYTHNDLSNTPYELVKKVNINGDQFKLCEYTFPHSGEKLTILIYEKHDANKKRSNRYF